MSSDLTPEQDAATRKVMLVGDFPAEVRQHMVDLLRPFGVAVVDEASAESLLDRVRHLSPMDLESALGFPRGTRTSPPCRSDLPYAPALARELEASPFQLPPLPPMPGLDTEPQPNREQRRRAEKNRRRRGAR